MSMNVVTLIRNAQYVEAVRLLEDCGPDARNEGILLLVDLLQVTMLPHWLRLLANLALSLYSEHSEASETYLTEAQKLYNTTTPEMRFPWLVRQLPVIAELIKRSRARLTLRKLVKGGNGAFSGGDVISFKPEDWHGLDAPGLRLTQTKIDDYFKPTPVIQAIGTAFIQTIGTSPRMKAAELCPKG